MGLRTFSNCQQCYAVIPLISDSWGWIILWGGALLFLNMFSSIPALCTLVTTISRVCSVPWAEGGGGSRVIPSWPPAIYCHQSLGTCESPVVPVLSFRNIFHSHHWTVFHSYPYSLPCLGHAQPLEIEIKFWTRYSPVIALFPSYPQTQSRWHLHVLSELYSQLAFSVSPAHYFLSSLKLRKEVHSWDLVPYLRCVSPFSFDLFPTFRSTDKYFLVLGLFTDLLIWAVLHVYIFGLIFIALLEASPNILVPDWHLQRSTGHRAQFCLGPKFSILGR